MSRSSGVVLDGALVLAAPAGLLADDPFPSETALAETASIFGLLADPGRLRLLTILRAEEANVGQLAARARMSESGASHALRLLRAHRIVQARRDGRMVHYRLADEHVRQLLDVAI